MGQIINTLFKKLLNKIITIVTYFHAEILSLNDSYELYLSDKQLHFYVYIHYFYILLKERRLYILLGFMYLLFFWPLLR